VYCITDNWNRHFFHVQSKILATGWDGNLALLSLPVIANFDSKKA